MLTDLRMVASLKFTILLKKIDGNVLQGVIEIPVRIIWVAVIFKRIMQANSSLDEYR